MLDSSKVEPPEVSKPIEESKIQGQIIYLWKHKMTVKCQ